MATGVNASASFPGSWTIYELVIGLVLNLVHGFLHIFFVPDLVRYIDAQGPAKACVCDLPEVPDVGLDATEQERADNLAAQTERNGACELQCPTTTTTTEVVVVEVTEVEEDAAGDGW